MSVDTTNVARWSRLASRLGSLGKVPTLCLPALANQGPLQFEDSRAYRIGGRVMHLTNLPLVLGLLVIAGRLRRRLWLGRTRYRMIGDPLGDGVIASLLPAGMFSIRQWTIAQQPPLLLVRSIADGPGRLNLLENCPQIGLAMWRHLDRIGFSMGDFLLLQDGVYSAVPVEEQAQLRTEDKHIPVVAALAHPWMEAQALIRNTLTQLVWFTLSDCRISSAAECNATEVMWPWHAAFSDSDCSDVIVRPGYALHAWLSGPPRDQRHFFILILTTILLEAFIADAFCVPMPRYEARMIWLLQMKALLSAYRGSNTGFRRL